MGNGEFFLKHWFALFPRHINDRSNFELSFAITFQLLIFVQFTQVQFLLKNQQISTSRTSEFWPLLARKFKYYIFIQFTYNFCWKINKYLNTNFLFLNNIPSMYFYSIWKLIADKNGQWLIFPKALIFFSEFSLFPRQINDRF